VQQFHNVLHPILMRKYILIVILTAKCITVDAQEEAATSAPTLNPFNLKGDELGSMAGYVNQLTGEVVFPMNLVSIPGPGGLGINVSIGYNSSNIENLVRIWNQEAPTGVLGLGWNMDMPLVMVDNKQTGARDDDEFYLVEGGSSIKLVCVGINSGLYSYRTSTYTNWVITYTPSSEKWEVIKDDGSRSIYGDTQGTANSVQYTARWGNWMGNSAASGQQLQAVIWNLREVRSVWGDRVTYSYFVGNISSGFGTLATEYSLLYKINDSWGHEVEFVPGMKTLDEYQHPQGLIIKRSERFFIDRMIVRTNGITDYEQKLNYSTNELGTGQLTKRLLKTITKLSLAGTIGPTVSFEYATVMQAYKGALTKVILPTGGSIGFTYDNGGYFYPKFIDRIENAPSGYAEPDVYIADDYALITWRQLSGGAHVPGPMTTIATVVDWKGKWRTHELGSIGAPRFDNNIKDYRVAQGKDFFATMVQSYGTTNFSVRLMHRKSGVNGEWLHSAETVDMGPDVSNQHVRLFTGNNFVCAANNNGRIFRFVWNGNAWIRTEVNESVGAKWVTATNNYILSHDPAPDPDVIKLYYLDQLMNWQTRTQNVTGFNSGVVDLGQGEITNWYPSNSSAFVMANESNEMIIQWDQNYNNIVRVDPGWFYGDNSNVYFDGTSLGVCTQIYYNPPNPFTLSKNRALRRSGNSWVDSGEKINGYGFANESGIFAKYGMAAFGPDMMAWNSNTNFSSTFYFKYQTFDPVAGQWSSEVQLNNTDNPHVNVGPDYFTIGRKVYRNTTTGYTQATYQNLSGNDDVFPSSRRFIASATRILWIRNGDVEIEYSSSGGNYRVRNSTSHPYRYMAGNSMYVYCTTGFQDNFQDDTSLFFRRVASVAGSYDHRVIKVQLDDGNAQQYVSFDYANPVYGPNEASVMYNKVTTDPGSQSVASKPNGHTDTYFYNSLAPSEVLSTIPSEYPNGNGIDYYDLLTGQSYRTETYNSSSTLMSSQSTMMRVTQDFFELGPQSYSYLYIPRPFKSIATQDGRTEIVDYVYDIKKQPGRITTSTQYASGLWNQRYQEFTYGYQIPAYSFMPALNMVSQVVLKKSGVTGESVTHAEASRWKQWSCPGTYCASTNVPAPSDQYAWRGTGSATFSAWDVGTQTPSGDWRYGGKINTRDPGTGAELETIERGDVKSSVILDNLKRPIASVSNAGLSDVAYTGLEDGTTGLWSSSDGVIITATAPTGRKYLTLGTTGLSRPGLTSTTQYRITFWAKTSGGSVQIDGAGTFALGTLSEWTLFQYTVTGLSTAGVRRSGATEVLIDDIRLHPVNSLMSTKTYHDAFGVDSETDANNRTMFTEFDEFGRPWIIRDQNRHIVRHYFTNRK